MKRNGASGNGWGGGAVCLAILLAASALRGGTLDPFAYEASSYVASASATYTFTYTIETAAPNMIFRVQFPSNFSCSAIGTDTSKVSVTVNGIPAGIGSCWGNDRLTDIRLTDPNVATAGANIVVVIQEIVNSPFPGTYNFNLFGKVYTADGGGNQIDAPAFIPSLTITAALTELTIGGTFDAESKTYDGTAAATIGAGHSLTLVGVVGGDDVTLSAVAMFADEDVADGKAVSLASSTLGGADTGKYTLSFAGAPPATADITAKGLTVTGLTGDDKIYDGNTDATASGAAALDGVVAPDIVTLDGTPTFSFASAAAGDEITITTAGYALGGTDASNYALTQPTLGADITAKDLVLVGLTAADKAFDGTTAATISGYGTLTGVVGADDVILDASGTTAAFDTAAVGVGKAVTVTGLALDGDDAGNYAIGNQATTADITQVALTIAANPEDGGTVEPALGDHAYTVDAPVDITATVAVGHEFAGWTVAGNATLGDADALTTTVTIHDDAGALVTANFAMLKVACGASFTVTAAEAGVPGDRFMLAPKVYALFDHPVTGKRGKASAKILAKPPKETGAVSVACGWTKKIRLHDAKALKAAEKAGVGAAVWLQQDPAPQGDLPLELHAAGKEIPDGDQPITPRALTPPDITGIVDNDDGTLSVTGEWFGNAAIKAWREVEVDGKEEGATVIKRQAIKKVKPTLDNTPHRNTKGKPACMDPVSGASLLILIAPPAPKTGVPGDIVIDNGVGIASVILPPAAP
jgi:hypothetical protein